MPFFVQRIVEFASQLPLDFNIRHENGVTTTKWVLREMLFEYAPRELIGQSKRSSSIATGNWRRGPLHELAESLFGNSRFKNEDYFNMAVLRLKCFENLSRKKNWRYQLWCSLMFQDWLDEHEKLPKP